MSGTAPRRFGDCFGFGPKELIACQNPSLLVEVWGVRFSGRGTL